MTPRRSELRFGYRRATREDDGFLFALHEAAFRAVVEATWGTWDEAVQRGFHTTWFDEPDRMSVLLLDDEPVGVVDAWEQPAGTLYLARLELMPAVQSRGLGSAVVGELVDRAREAGLRAVELHVLDRNERARRLYERLGFDAVEVAPPKVRMRRRVTRSSP